MSTSVPNGVIVVSPTPGKTVDSSGVVISEKVDAQAAHVSTMKGQNITLFPFLEFDDTTGPITEAGLEIWEADRGAKRGYFFKANHGGDQPTGRLFVVLQGSAGFRYSRPGAPEQSVTLVAISTIYFPPGVTHDGFCVGQEPAQVLVMDVREATHPCDANSDKGANIPF